MRSAASIPIRVVRLIRLLGHLVRGLLIVVILFPRADRPKQRSYIEDWARRLLRILAIDVAVRGHPDAKPALVVANHISWLDIFVLDSVRALRFVSKAEVARWPLIGRLASAAGTLYLRRENRHAVMGIVEGALEALRNGDSVGIFPEGTTGDGYAVRPFHASLFAAAHGGGCIVQPVAIAYLNEAGELAQHAVYSGNTTLIQSVLSILAARRTVALLTFTPAIDADGRTRRELATLARTAIENVLRVEDRPPQTAPDR